MSRVLVMGATGLIGSRLVARLRGRGDEVTVLSRDPALAHARLGVPAHSLSDPTPLTRADAIVNLAGEPVAQRWTTEARKRIRDSRVQGTARLVAALEAASPRPAVLVCASAAGIYGNRGDTLMDESAPPGDDFLASVCVEWEAAAAAAASLGVRVVSMRTGVVLDRSGGALKQMLLPFRLGVGGPIAGGRQYLPWIHIDDVVGLHLAALDGGDAWSGAVNASAPAPVTNAEFSHALGRVLHRPAVMPVPAFALRLLYGEMASVVIGGQRMVPARAHELGYEFGYSEEEVALRRA